MVRYTLEGNKCLIDIAEATRKGRHVHIYAETPNF